MLAYIDSNRAVEIAVKFFEQYNSGVVVDNVTFNGTLWTVYISFGLINKKNKQVKIDAITGTILEYSSIEREKNDQ
ncbi:MAG: hypothetical protein ACREA7_01080 [Nitrosotalea sp.]